jgi:hypothetical protein
MSITTTGDRLEVIHDPAVDDRPQAVADTTDRPTEPGADVAEVQASARPTFTITDAATSCSVSRKTITRKLPELAGHGAAKDEDGVWRIPVEALLGVGLHPGRSLPEVMPSAARPVAPMPIPVRPTEQDTVTIPRDRWDDVRIRLARAEAEAAERGLALADARLALRALTAGPVTASRSFGTATDQDHGAPSGPPRAFPEAGAARAAGATPERPQGSPPVADVTTPIAGKHPDSGSVVSAAVTTAGVMSPESGGPAPGDGVDATPADIVAARNLAARTGGYVPAGATAVKKRRWWQSR